MPRVLPAPLETISFFSTPTIDVEPNFLRTRARQKLLFLELGVGYNTPGIIKYPFWQMTMKNPKATYACLNAGEAYAPEEIGARSICVNGDVGETLDRMLE